MLVYLDKQKTDRATRVKETSLANIGWREADLEGLLANNMDLVFPEEELMLLGTQRAWQEEADILALDIEGVLHIFELKRWDATAESLLQVLRYGQKFGRFDYERLDRMYERITDDEREKSLQEAHREYFGRDESLAESDFNLEQRFVVVAAGIDYDTWEAVRYWKSQGLSIELMLYRVYAIGEGEEDAVLDIEPYAVSSEAMPVSAVNTGYYVLNSNRTYDPDAYKDMLDRGRASAYGGRQHVMERLKPHDRVYLYHTGIGLIAAGTVTGRPEYDDWKRGGSVIENEELYVDVTWNWVADPRHDDGKIIPARAINEVWDASYRFRQTLFGISEEQAKALDDLLAERNA